MSKKLVCMASLCLCLSWMGCSSNSKTSKEQEEPQPKQLVGGDKDEHGCIASAGYQWSELLKDCIRPFEKGVKCVSATDEDTTFAAYIVFSNDSSQVELFLPKSEVRPILTRQTEGDCWTSTEGEAPAVRLEKGVYQIERQDQPWYVQQK